MNFFSGIDASAFILLNSLSGRSPLLDTFIVFTAESLTYILPTIFIVLLYLATHSYRDKIHMAGTVFFSGFFVQSGITEFIRLYFHRLRPYLVYDIDPLFYEDSFSFPSAHSAFFFAFAFAIYHYNKKWGVWFLSAATLMTIARIISGVHYPSDIIAGMLVGLAVAYLTFKYLGPTFKKIAYRFV